MSHGTPTFRFRLCWILLLAIHPGPLVMAANDDSASPKEPLGAPVNFGGDLASTGTSESWRQWRSPRKGLARISRVNDEPSGAIELDPLAPSISDTGDDATYSEADTSEMQIQFPPWAGGSQGHGGGSLWYRWRSPITGIVTVTGWGIFQPRLFIDRELLLTAVEGNWPVGWAVEAGQEYLLAVVGPSQMADPEDFGLGFYFHFHLRTEPLVELVSPTAEQVFRTGEDVLLSARRVAPSNSPPDSMSVGFLIDGWWWSDYLAEPYSAIWNPSAPGIYRWRALIHLATGQQLAVGPDRFIKVVPNNDNFSDREMLTGVRTNAGGNTWLAGLEAGERSLTGAAEPRSIWWKWRAPVAGEYQLTVTETDPDKAALGVYLGDSLTSLSLWAASPVFQSASESWGTNSVKFTAQADQEFAFVYEETGLQPDYGMSIAIRPLPANDTVARAERLEGLMARVSGLTDGATADPGEPPHGGRPPQSSVWYRWRAPDNGIVSLRLTGNSRLAVYVGNELSSLSRVGDAVTGYQSATYAGEVFKNTDYLLAVDRTEWSEPATFNLLLAFTPIPTPTAIRMEAFPLGNGVLQCLIFGAAPDEVVVSGSPDLKTWTDLGSFRPDPDGVIRLQQYVDDSGGRRFLNARTIP